MTPPELVDDFVAVLRDVGTAARKRGRVVIVEDDTEEPERRLELLFFLRTWALSHPELVYEVLESR